MRDGRDQAGYTDKDGCCRFVKEKAAEEAEHRQENPAILHV
jgi:hypothetical protein